MLGVCFPGSWERLLLEQACQGCNCKVDWDSVLTVISDCKLNLHLHLQCEHWIPGEFLHWFHSLFHCVWGASIAMYRYLTSKMPGALWSSSRLFMMYDILGGSVMMPSREALSNPDSCSQIPIRMKTDDKLHIMRQLCQEVMNCKLNLENIHYSF